MHGYEVRNCARVQVDSNLADKLSFDWFPDLVSAYMRDQQVLYSLFDFLLVRIGCGNSLSPECGRVNL